MASIWATCRNPGGTLNLLPVIRCLRQSNHKFFVFAEGTAQAILQKEGEYFFDLDIKQLETFVRDTQLDLLLTTMCGKANHSRYLTATLRTRGVPIIALQDTHIGDRLWKERLTPEERPDYICVNDQVGANIIRLAWPDFPPKNIFQTGFPALDKYACLPMYREEADDLGVTESWQTVFYGGQLRNSATILAEIVTALNQLSRPVYFIPRAHARMAIEAPEEVAPWQQALQAFSNGQLIQEIPNDISETVLLAISSLVLAKTSAVLNIAAAMHKPSIAVLYPDVGMKDFYGDCDNHLAEHPLVSLGCVAKAVSQEKLQELINAALFLPLEKLGLYQNQEQHFRLDGRNAQRTAQAISRLLPV